MGPNSTCTSSFKRYDLASNVLFDFLKIPDDWDFVLATYLEITLLQKLCKSDILNKVRI